MAIVEEYFPRGGKAKAEKKEQANEKRKKTDNLFKVKTLFHIFKQIIIENLRAFYFTRILQSRKIKGVKTKKN